MPDATLAASYPAYGIAPVSYTHLDVYKRQALGFADCSVVPQPTAAQLADIALASAETWRAITGEEPRVAMLSFSSNGSARHPCVANVQQATEIVGCGTSLQWRRKKRLPARYRARPM